MVVALEVVVALKVVVALEVVAMVVLELEVPVGRLMFH